jgi:hypothetical protein
LVLFVLGLISVNVPIDTLDVASAERFIAQLTSVRDSQVSLVKITQDADVLVRVLVMINGFAEARRVQIALRSLPEAQGTEARAASSSLPPI